MGRILGLLLVLAGGLFAADNDWYRWRGVNEDGMARGDAPIEWSDTKNVAWRTPVPGRGFSSPVVWGDKIFVTSAVPIGEAAAAAAPPAGPQRGGRGGAPGGAGMGPEYRFVLLCIDRNNGKVLWERVAATAKPHEGYHPKYGSFASNSPIVDGKYVYAFFGSRGLFAYDLAGKLIWQKDFAPMRTKNQFGEGAAPAIDGDLLYLKFDQEEDSYLAAVDKKTGKEVWRVPRDEQTSWSQPVVVAYEGKKQLVVSASKKTRSYDAATGKLIWETAGLGANVIPAPVAAGGLVFVMSGYRDPNLQAIRLGRDGDLAGTDAIVWKNDRGNSYTPSPVLHDNKLYMVTDNGMISCLNATTGEAFYRQQRLPKPYNFKSSPVGAGGNLYLATEEGDVVIVKMGEKYEVVATNTLTDQTFIATPAIVGGSIYLRSQDTLFCIRAK